MHDALFEVCVVHFAYHAGLVSGGGSWFQKHFRQDSAEILIVMKLPSELQHHDEHGPDPWKLLHIGAWCSLSAARHRNRNQQPDRSTTELGKHRDLGHPPGEAAHGT